MVFTSDNSAVKLVLMQISWCFLKTIDFHNFSPTFSRDNKCWTRNFQQTLSMVLNFSPFFTHTRQQVSRKKKKSRAAIWLEADIAHVACILFNFWCCCLFAQKNSGKIFLPRSTMAYVFPLRLLQCIAIWGTCENLFKFFFLFFCVRKCVTSLLFLCSWRETQIYTHKKNEFAVWFVFT